MNHFDRLPIELVSSIVKQLCQKDLYTCTFINKPFYTAATPYLWQSVYLRQTSSLLNIIHANSPQSLGQHIRSISFSDEQLVLCDSTFLSFIKLTPLLESLTLQLQHNYTTNASLQQIGVLCPKLSYICFCWGLITSNTIHSLGQHCHHLDALVLEHCVVMSSDVFSAFATCPLETLVLQGSSFFDLKNSNAVTTTTTLSNNSVLNSAGLQRLVYLWIDGTSLFFDASHCIATTHDAQGNVIWPHLKGLWLTTCHWIDDTHLIEFIQLHPQLEALHFVSLQLTDAALDAIAVYLPNIQTLALYRNYQFTHEAVRRLVKACPMLTYFGLNGCELPWKDFPELAAAMPDSHNRQYITQLEKYTLDTIRHVSDFTSDDSNNNNNNNE